MAKELEKNKSKILNIGIILLAVFVAFHVYRLGEEQANVLLQQKDQELKKNSALEDITRLERKMNMYKNVLVKKDLSAVMDTVSAIAKKSSVKIVSVKPSESESAPAYIKSSFNLVINAPNYHSLGSFIGQVENYKDIYIVEDVNITLADPNKPGAGLNVNLRISTIAYL